MRPPPSTTLFPYTTLFRSRAHRDRRVRRRPEAPRTPSCPCAGDPHRDTMQANGCGSRRSEEHTSELQSRRELVCRLLLEKKNEALYDTPIMLCPGHADEVL